MAELLRTPGEVRRDDGSIEHGVFVRPQAGKNPEVLVHLSVAPTGHASMIFYDEHPNYNHTEQAPRDVLAERAKRFLDAGGDKWLGHPRSPEARAIEVARVKAKHGLS